VNVDDFAAPFALPATPVPAMMLSFALLPVFRNPVAVIDPFAQ
jgi:hypothetical protein